jgi:hypothetical protein
LTLEHAERSQKAGIVGDGFCTHWMAAYHIRDM